MKNLRAIVEVEEPKAAGEKRFKDKHIIALIKDVEGNAEVPYKAGPSVEKDKSKLTHASKEDEADMYETHSRVTLTLQKNKMDYFKRDVVEDAEHQDKGSPIMTPGQVDTMAKLTKERITGHHLKWDGNVRKQYFDLVKTFNAQIKQGAIAGSGKFIANEEVENNIIEVLTDISKNDSGTIHFANGDEASISGEVAEQLLSIYEELTPSNATKFQHTISKSEAHLQKMIEFSQHIGDE